MKKLISVVTPTYNEQANVEEVIRQVRVQFETHLPDYDFEHIIIDNCSSDSTVAKVKRICQTDKRIRLIVNSRNFGHIRSPAHAMKRSRGNAAILLVADLQDPPSLIPEFVRVWEKEGFKLVLGVKRSSEESPLFFQLRRAYYFLVSRLAEVELVPNFTGFGLYDRKVIDVIRNIDDPYPYWRGLICEIGFSRFLYAYDQPIRRRGITKNNFYTLYDIAMLGITTHSKLPLRLCTIFGFLSSLMSMFIALLYVGVKLLNWNEMQLGIAPLVIGMFFFASVQLFVIGFLGEYVGNIHTQVLRRPLVIEMETINFDE